MAVRTRDSDGISSGIRLIWPIMPPLSSGQEPPVPTVTEITRQIRESLEGRFADVWVEGEISNYRPHSSGHHYFTLKDDRAQLSCVMFRNQARALPEPIRDGRQVQARGDISVYEARGQYQLVVRWMQPRGFGALQARFEALKRQLEAEGLFDPDRKKPLPFFPRTVALVTSPTGAAIRDMLNILGRRSPWLRILVWPVKVQGDGAGREIAEALRGLGELSGKDGFPRIDVVIAGRGGGSIEDLWSFNEEVVARAIHACPLPVISAVGHEIDFTIADFVADLRAPTPSAAAELVAPDRADLMRQLDQLHRSLSLRVGQSMSVRRTHVDFLWRTLASREPMRVIGEHLQQCDEFRDRLEEEVDAALRRSQESLAQQRRILDLKHPGAAIGRGQESLSALLPRLERRLGDTLAKRAERLASTRQILELLSPQMAFQRGFSLTTDAAGRVVTDASMVAAGDRLHTRLAKGEIESVVA